jgi:hypothetical protein
VDAGGSLKFFPNPVDGLLYVKGFSAGTKILRVILNDVSGRMVYENNNPFAPGGNLELGVEHLESGVYYARVETEDGTVNRKFIKR